MCGWLSERTFFGLRMIALLRVIYARSRRIENKLDRLQDQLTRMEIMMSDILAKLDALKAQADAYTTEQGNKIAAAVAAARKAQQAEDQESARAETESALAKIDEIGKGLVTFSPSGN